MKRFFKGLSISKKLAAVFIFLLFMMGVGGSVGLYNASQIANVTESLYLNSFKRGELLQSIENEFLSARQEMFLQTIINDLSSKSYLDQSIEEHKKKIDRLLHEYKGMVEESSFVLYNAFIEQIAGYWRIHTKVAELSRQGQRDSALSIVRLEGNKSFTDAIDSLRKLIKMERDAAYTAYHRSEAFADVIIVVTLGITLLAIALAAGFWIILIRVIVRPLIMLVESARKIGQGFLKARAPVLSDDEIGNLAVEFNKMAASIEEHYVSLENKVSGRTEELRLANVELSNKKHEFEEANVRLTEANRMKSQFLANVSHELRTPLNSIIGFSDLLLEKSFGELNERQSQYLGFVHSSGEHLLKLINNILDLSKIEAGRMDVVFEVFPISEAIGETFGIVKPIAHKRSITITAKTAPASPKLKADKAKFKQIMLNLITNAIKFNVDGGAVTIDWDIAEEQKGVDIKRFIVFKVMDNGIGIKSEDKDKLFNEFGQLDSTITKEYGGTGLGLVLTKRLVELHKGEIWFESEYGKGSTFYVKFPQGTDEIDMPLTPKPVYSAENLERRMVLLASESQDISHLLDIYLSGSPYDAVAARDGVELMRMAGEQRPFAIIMGIALPKKDGWEVLKELKQDKTTAGIPVIIISSNDNRDLGLKLGAADYMEKPVNREKLLASLERLRPGPGASGDGLAS
ncbi:MAG: MCP four helix bundle domain-containing protein [Deltaproteobacteria bacterium]|nr:MCP four helix bundle domain-containing protein [Deltaproteobacteria bacterium]